MSIRIRSNLNRLRARSEQLKTLDLWQAHLAALARASKPKNDKHGSIENKPVTAPKPNSESIYTDTQL